MKRFDIYGMGVCFAAAAASGTAAPKNNGTQTPPPAPTPATDAKKPRAAAPIITAITTDIPIPENKANRGAKTVYDFDNMPVGGSFGVKNKTAAQMSSVISQTNRKYSEPKKDENGNIVYKTKKIKDAEGKTVSRVATDKPERVAVRNYFAIDVDPKTDRDGASVRVFREK